MNGCIDILNYNKVSIDRLKRGAPMSIEDAIRFVVEEVEDPALEHPSLEDSLKNKVRRSKTIVHRIKKSVTYTDI